ncbi:serine hydrolase domain-containing protein [Mucilaginibacter ginkgonis]|uniref:Beta-lactamase family protein n=1 Tax=Mucilaginibacter ginkgonis TaxID=2682091 RepID=A0A6I4I0J3_9SPHI|nr:serine hydrolase domain-containing protein [Mucilaginibacter ginkgonis]QQL51080.1 beta-lactamase family protein [Mucilaginibacter ginkgonis]
MKRLNLTLTILALSIICYGQAVPTSPALNNKFQQFINAYNTGDTLKFCGFYASETPNDKLIEKSVKQTLSEYSFSGKLKLMKVKPTSPTETTIVARNESFGCWFEIYWITDANQHYKEHHMRPIRLSSDFLQTGLLSQQQVLTEADAYIKGLADQKVFAGNLLIAKDGKILYNKSFGTNPAGAPNTSAQQFDLASMGKLFTTISVLQLADQHKLSLTDSVGKLIPQLKNKSLRGITVEQLLTHTSGMGDFFEDPAFDPMNGKKFTEADVIPAIEKDQLHFPPGKEFRYSNTGFLLLGLIVEKQSGQDFKTYVREHIFKPAQMMYSEPANGAGGGMSTVNDIYSFSKAISDNKLLSPATTKQFLTFNNANWGLGQEYQQLGNEVITGHSGGFPGICTELNMYQNAGYTVVILSNTEPPFGHFISDKIKELVVRR